MSLGSVLIAAGAVVALACAFPLRSRLGPSTLIVALALAGAGVGWGGMELQPDPSTGELVAAIAMLAVLVPAHVRIVLGPFGPLR